jgi:dihydrofolate synthase/folylpolyglutamate synthase
MTYREAIEFFDSLESLGIRPGLERIRALLERLGNPHRAFPSLLIAGTNGKGSVAAYLAAILREARVAAGVYTSPHLVRFEERIAVDGSPIGEDEVATLAAEVRAAIEAGRARGEEMPTYFEATTALAFLEFRRLRVPLAVLEVGMGGRFDATNVVTPVACAITPIAFDHMQWLGASLPEIAHQKAGILKTGVPCVVARQDPEALRVIEREAEGAGAPLVPLATAVLAPSGGGRRFADPPVFDLTTPSGERHERLEIALRGAHQVENAAVAVLVAGILREGGFPGLDHEAVRRGLAAAAWPGRLELLPGEPDLLLDGAHNPAGCATLAAYLRDYHPGRRVVLVFSALRDKPAGEMLDLLGPLAAEVIVTRLRVPRGETAEALQLLASARHPRVSRAESTAAALRAARALAGPAGLVVVGGSLYLVGEAKQVV